MDAIAFFSNELSDEDVQYVCDVTGAEDVSEIDEVDTYFLTEFCRLIRGQLDCEDIFGYRLKKFMGISGLLASPLAPALIFHAEEGVMETLQKYGEIAMMAEHVQRPLDVVRGGLVGILEGKMKLKLPINKRFVDMLADDVRPVFEKEFADIVEAGRQYYQSVSPDI